MRLQRDGSESTCIGGNDLVASLGHRATHSQQAEQEREEEKEKVKIKQVFKSYQTIINQE